VKMLPDDSTNGVSANMQAERVVNLHGDTTITNVRVFGFYFNNQVNNGLFRFFSASPLFFFRVKAAVFFLNQRLVKTKNSGGL